MTLKFDELVEQLLAEAMATRREGESVQKYEHRIQKGQRVEDEFLSIMQDKGFIANPASREDERNGIDFFVYEGKKDKTGKLIPAWSNLPENARAGRNSGTVETKGNKVVNGNLLVELINEGYYKGWLFAQANYISFQQSDHLQFIRTYALREMMQKKLSQVIPSGKLFDIMNLIDGPNTSKFFPRVETPAEAVFPKIFRRPAKQQGKMDAITRVPWEEVLQYAGSSLKFAR
jgi:hypothetical protein